MTGTSFYFVEAPDEPSEVVEWFRALTDPPKEAATDYGLALHFISSGPLISDGDGDIDTARSPATVVLPKVRRGVLWTVGEVNFLSTLSLPENKAVRSVASSFKKWLRAQEQVYGQSLESDSPFDYFLEGSCKNWGDIYGLPTGIAYLNRGGYVVSHKDNDFVLDHVCKLLRLRGIDCGAGA
jgi:hypothetical protein